jgi:hypothetical protein
MKSLASSVWVCVGQILKIKWEYNETTDFKKAYDSVRWENITIFLYSLE